MTSSTRPQVDTAELGRPGVHRLSRFRRLRASGTPSPRRGHIGAVRSILVNRPATETIAVLRDIELLEPLERKARGVVVHADSEQHGWYHIDGKLAALAAWEGDFRYDQHDVGWHSADLHPRDDGWGISGGFLVAPVGRGQCRITHYEDYFLPPRLRWMRFPMWLYMRWSQVGEMRDLVGLVERQVEPETADAAGSR